MRDIIAHQSGSTARQWAAPNTDVGALITVVQSGKFHCRSSSAIVKDLENSLPTSSP